MSDLAPFVAAALRDKVVADLQDEVKHLREQLEREKRQSQTVAITGPQGSPVYAHAQFRDGKHDYSPELWKVELSTTGQRHSGCCLVEDLAEMEVRIGGICKAKLSNGIVEGFVNDIENNYDDTRHRGALSIWFGGSSGIWLNVQIEPIARHQYARLRDFDLGGESLVGTLLHCVPPYTQIIFTEASFLISYVNGAMYRWGIEDCSDDAREQEAAETTQYTGDARRTLGADLSSLRIIEEEGGLSISSQAPTLFIDAEDSGDYLSGFGVSRVLV